MLQCYCMCVCCSTQSFLIREDQVGQPLLCPSCGRRLYPHRPEPFGETEWLSCEDPKLVALWRDERTTPRKLRLFACACCRLMRGQLTDSRSWRAVEVAERFADGQASAAELREAAEGAHAAATRFSIDIRDPIGWMAAATAEEPIRLSRLLAHLAPPYPAGQRTISARAVDLFRDVIGNPFRPLPVLDEAVLAFDGGIVSGLARSIYDDRAFERMPILGDALEEAGCTDPFVLSHCHNGGEHVRGCWVVDLVQGRG